MVNHTCGGTSSRSLWVFPALASSGPGRGTALPRRRWRPGPPPVPSLDSWCCIGQGSPASSTGHKQAAARLAEQMLDTRHVSVLARQKPQPDLQTPRLWLDCRPRGFAKHPQGESVNPLMWCAGSNQVPRNGWHDTRSCWTTGRKCWTFWFKKKKNKGP